MATRYDPLRIALTDRQKVSLGKAIAAETPVTLRLKPGQIGRGDEILFTAMQINRLKRAVAEGRGADLRFSKTRIENAVQHGGNLFLTALSLARPFLAPAAKKKLPAKIWKPRV